MNTNTHKRFRVKLRGTGYKTLDFVYVKVAYEILTVPCINNADLAIFGDTKPALIINEFEFTIDTEEALRNEVAHCNDPEVTAGDIYRHIKGLVTDHIWCQQFDNMPRYNPPICREVV